MTDQPASEAPASPTPIDVEEPALFEIGADEPDIDALDAGGKGDDLRAEGVAIPFELAQHGNGQLPADLLVPIGIASHRLHPVAAAGFARLRSLASGAGIDLTCSDSYRSFELQVAAKKAKPDFTATPGRSVHGWGFALDLSVGTPPKPFGPWVLSWLEEHGPPNGWHLGRPKDEPWHWVYRGVGEDVAAATRAARPEGTSATTPVAGAGLDADEIAAIAGDGELTKGASGTGVRILRALLDLDAGTAFDDETDAAVRAFQSARGLVADGKVGPQTWTALRSVSAPVERPELRRESTGDPVKWVQRRLGALPDGDYGERTEARVIAFQSARSLVPDGVVGPKTWTALTS